MAELFTNRLIKEKSPYLLQHAHNPVDWYPWSDEAFQAAKDQDRPIFLSIGYATCHWCHVMEQESFQNVEVAQLMNQNFINIKVDREEKPEVDSLYMEFAQVMMAGGAGWPLNVILTPDLMPFFAATYLPSDAVRGFLGMKQLIMRIAQIWAQPEERENVIAQAGKIVDIFANHLPAEKGGISAKEKIAEAVEMFLKIADPSYGGSKGAPKFPIGIQACFLLRFVRDHKDSRALFYVERTLDMMHRGGIYDHLGGGFSRYSIDEKWRVLHFEKMIYDNALVVRAYVESWAYTRQIFYREVTEHILKYVLTEMTDPLGGFYSAQDADSEGHEGRFYTWTWDEIQAALGKEARLFCDFYGVTSVGNFEGRNILHTPMKLEEFANHYHIDPEMFNNLLKDLRQKLWVVRENRPKPAKDDKIVTGWNGLMIHSLCKASHYLNKVSYLEAAEKCAVFIREKLWNEETLFRRWREGEARFDGCLDDYACMIQGLLSLFEADRGSEWLEFALTLADVVENDFKAEQGGYYLTNGKDPHLILRRCEFYDGAEPSGNAVHTENLIRLYQITGVIDYLQRAEDVLRAAREHIELYPPGACYHLLVMERYYDREKPTIIIALNKADEFRDEIEKMLAGDYIPHKVVIWRRDSDEELRDFVPIVRNKHSVGEKTTLYLCFADRCLLPITELSKMWEAIEKL